MAAGGGALAAAVMPGADAAFGEAPDAELATAGVSFGVGEVEAGHFAVAGEAVGEAGFDHLAVDGAVEAVLVEDADDASVGVLGFPDFEGEALAFGDFAEAAGGFGAEGLVVFGGVDGVEADFEGFALASEPAEADGDHAVAVLDAGDSNGEGIAATHPN